MRSQSVNYPGDLEATQLGFDGEYIRFCFSGMSGADFSFFIMGNLVDYLFMVSYGALFFSSSLILSRRLRQGSLGRKVGYTVSILGRARQTTEGTRKTPGNHLHQQFKQFSSHSVAEQ